MLWFGRIPGLKIEAKRVFLRREYGWAKFHVNEIDRIEIRDGRGELRSCSDFPLWFGQLVFCLKSGRKRPWYGRLSHARYQKVLAMIEDARLEGD